MIAIVAAIDKNRVIGSENKIPWRLRDDLVALRNLTLGHTVILGRRTYESMDWYYTKYSRKMPGQTYIVVTRNPDLSIARPNVRVAHSIDEARQLAQAVGDPEVLVIGGRGIFEAMLPYVERIYLTEVDAEVQGDAYFPELVMSEWREVSRTHHHKDERNQYDYDVVVLDRI